MSRLLVSLPSTQLGSHTSASSGSALAARLAGVCGDAGAAGGGVALALPGLAGLFRPFGESPMLECLTKRGRCSWEGFQLSDIRNQILAREGLQLRRQRAASNGGNQRVLMINVGVGCFIECAGPWCHCKVSRLHEVIFRLFPRQTANRRTGMVLFAGGVDIEPGRRRCVGALCSNMS